MTAPKWGEKHLQFYQIQAVCSSCMCSDQRLPKTTCQRLSRKQAHRSNMNNTFSAKSNEHLCAGIYIGSPGGVNSIAGFGREEWRWWMPKERNKESRLWSHVAQDLCCANEPGQGNGSMDQWAFSKQRPLPASKNFLIAHLTT